MHRLVYASLVRDDPGLFKHGCQGRHLINIKDNNMLNYKRVIAGSILFFSTISAAFSNPLLSEVYYDPSGADNGLEWIELYNDSNCLLSDEFDLGLDKYLYFIRN